MVYEIQAEVVRCNVSLGNFIVAFSYLLFSAFSI